jgi:hypothetical protein
VCCPPLWILPPTPSSLILQSALASGTDCTLHATIISLRALRDPSIAIHPPSSDYKENGGRSISRWSEFQSIKRGGFHSRVGLIGSCERIDIRLLREQDKGYKAHENHCGNSVLPHHRSSRTRNCESHSSYNHIPLTPKHHNYYASRYRALLARRPQRVCGPSLCNDLQLRRSRQPDLTYAGRDRVRTPTYYAFPQRCERT